MRVTRVTDWLEAQGSLDAAGQPVTAAVQKVIRGGPIKDVLSGTWLGHPLHPILVMVPIGSWTSASLIDLLGRGQPGATAAARRLIGVGVITALPSALSGLSDWSDTAGAEQRVGVVHATLNSVALALYGASWWVRRRSGGESSSPAGTVLALAGMTVATGAGYLGGHLIYSQGVGVDTNSFHTGPDEWETVAAVDDLPESGGLPVTAGRDSLLVVLQGGDRIRAIGNRCSHRGAPLSDGEIKGDCVTCPWHGSTFDLRSGDVVAGPAVVGQPVYETRVDAGQVQVRRHEERSLRTNPIGPG